VYGVLSQSVNQRIQEIGIRMALGAESKDILRLIVWQGLLVLIIGIAAGIAGAIAISRIITSLLYGVGPTDPVTYAIVSIVLMIVAITASYIPARRAIKVDPMVALRYE